MIHYWIVFIGIVISAASSDAVTKINVIEGTEVMQAHNHLKLEEALQAVKDLGSNIDSFTRIDEYKYLLVHALTAMPKKSALRVIRECRFIDFDEKRVDGFFVHAEDMANKHLICISAPKLEKVRETSVKIILHELAHFELGHRSHDSSEEREEAANKKADEWFEIWKQIRPPNWKDKIYKDKTEWTANVDSTEGG